MMMLVKWIEAKEDCPNEDEADVIEEAYDEALAVGFEVKYEA